eukprot:CAMPEP_0170489906 /NCGR_PEP_ID=MMETSP0208-20121228/8206_1 /TAXON_ID=197538 /ORGANISM="Strombidium inclinatum, Strain S3" /LENGTH=121 /DNA_ID=CAMNT_0010765063 /DNA_START=729 /DNA_END=1094 /DNA_ORIENTATION=+
MISFAHNKISLTVFLALEPLGQRLDEVLVSELLVFEVVAFVQQVVTQVQILFLRSLLTTGGDDLIDVDDPFGDEPECFEVLLHLSLLAAVLLRHHSIKFNSAYLTDGATLIFIFLGSLMPF